MTYLIRTARGDSLVSRERYVAWLRECADMWERGGPSWSSDPPFAAKLRQNAAALEEKR